MHLGIIPDGNRRYAKSKGLTLKQSYEHGSEVLKKAVKWALRNPNINELSIYMFSEENFKRSLQELNWLNKVYKEGLEDLINLDLLRETQTRVNMITTNLVALQAGIFFDTLYQFERLRIITRDYTNKDLNILIAYTGKKEIAQATGTLRNRIKNLFFGLTEKDITKGMQIQSPCDLIIRSSNEEAEREAKSGFLIWQSAYSEYYHVKKNWGDVTIKDLDKALAYYTATRRNYGT